MQTLGIDLASHPGDTSACLIQWGAGGADVLDIQSKLDDRDLMALTAQPDNSPGARDGTAIGV